MIYDPLKDPRDAELDILEVDPWTRTPILVDSGTFAIPLSMYEWVPIPSSDTDKGIRIGCI